MNTILPYLWLPVPNRDRRALAIFERHYSARPGTVKHLARLRHGFIGPGEKMVLISPLCDALFIWRHERIRRDSQTGINCALFRNEGPALSSRLILAAEACAWQRWPRRRLFTFINPSKIRSTNPGYCFLRAGWTKCGHTNLGLLILEKRPLPLKEPDHD